MNDLNTKTSAGFKSGSNRIKDTAADKVFFCLNYIFLSLCFLIVVIPLMNLVSQSLSSPPSVYAGRVLVFPIEPSFEGYRKIVSDSRIIGGFYNSIIIAVVGTVISVTLTLMAAYPLSRKSLYGRMVFTWMFTFTMLFGAGLVPNYLLIQSLGMIDSLWAMIIPNAVGAWNIIISRTFFQNTIPDELYDAATIDGCSDIGIFLRIVLPLSRPIIAIMVLYSTVGLWNGYFDAMIYLQNQAKFPLQLVLRNIMTSANLQLSMTSDMVLQDRSKQLAQIEVMKYAVIVFSSLPLIILYPFIQKHFVKGVMIGAIKG